MGFCGLFLRYTSLAKTALGQFYKGEKKLGLKEWDLSAMLEEMLKSSEELYGVRAKNKCTVGIE